MNIQNIIRDIKQRALGVGLTLNDLCRESGVSASNFSRWENDKTTPTLSSIQKLEAVISLHKDNTPKKLTNKKRETR